MPPKKATAAAEAKKAAPKASASKVTKAAKPTKAAAAATTTKKAAPKATPKATTNGVAKEPAKRGRPKKAADTPAAPAAKTLPKRPKKDAKKDDAAKASFSTEATNESAQDQSQSTQATVTSKTTASPGPAPVKASRKRKAEAEPEAPVAKKIRIARLKEDDKNKAPTQKLNVYVFGEGSSGELGLGTAKNAVDVKRPRLNPLLPADSVGIVQVAAGGMHVLALTHDNKILSWGVNDQGALGRDTTWEGGLVDMDDAKSDSDSESGSDSGMNPHEATPTAIPSDTFPEGTVFTQVAAADSASFAVTDEGLVYGWGTFRSNEGIFGFSKTSFIQKTPVLIPELKKIRYITCGANHCLALNADGNVFAWGSGQQNQLGRRVVERTKAEGLVPREFGLPRKRITQVSCGSYHSFAVDKTGNVYAWGLNNFGETGIPDNAGEDDAIVLKPVKVDSLSNKKIKMIDGGGHHSAAVTEDGKCLVWGRLDGYQMGIKMDTLKGLPEEQIKKDEHGRPRILKVPTVVPGINATYVTCGSDHTIAITKEGKAYSWGFSANYQCGLGTDDDIEVATMIDNTAVREKKLNWAGAGGQYSILTAPAEDKPLVNGTH